MLVTVGRERVGHLQPALRDGNRHRIPFVPEFLGIAYRVVALCESGKAHHLVQSCLCEGIVGVFVVSHQVRRVVLASVQFRQVETPLVVGIPSAHVLSVGIKLDGLGSRTRKRSTRFFFALIVRRDGIRVNRRHHVLRLDHSPGAHPCQANEYIKILLHDHESLNYPAKLQKKCLFWGAVERFFVLLSS